MSSCKCNISNSQEDSVKKRFIVITIVLIAGLVSAAVYLCSLIFFSVIYVSEWQWVKVEEPIKSGNATLLPGSTCGIGEHGIAKPIGIRDGKVLYRYFTIGTQYGTNCPSGLVFTFEEDRP